jgi:hypothetical protein
MTDDMNLNDSYLDDDIPVVDSSGARHIVHGTGIVDGQPAASPAAPFVAAPPSQVPSAGDERIAVKDDMSLMSSGTPDEVRAVAESDRFQEALKGAEAMEIIWGRMADESVSELHLDADMHRRFRKLAELYFRDLRDSLETMSKMTMPIASGGMGMNDEQAESVMAILKGKNDALASRLSSQKSGDKDRYLGRLAADSLKSAVDEAEADKAELDDLYARIIRSTGRLESPPLKASPEPRRIPVQNHDEPVGDEEASSEVVVPVAARSAGVQSDADANKSSLSPLAPPDNLPIETPEAADAKTASIEAKPVFSMPAEGNTKPLRPAVVASPPQRFAPAAAPMSAVAASRPSVLDIKGSPKLTGPVEEIGQLNPDDFRRLSRDPKEACLKVMDKIDILGERSFELKGRGIRAWQDSPVNRLYLDMLRESLDGKPITIVIEGRERSGQPALSKPEFEAIMDLNRKLRFG